MTQEQEAVKEFMILAGQDCPTKPTLPPVDVCNLRSRLIQEELDEFINGYETDNIVEVADGLADLLVVVLGSAVSFGLDIKPIFDEVMRSNMTKFIDGYRRADGKWVKGPSYEPANIAPLVREQS